MNMLAGLSHSVKEPKTSDDGGSNKEGKKLPPAVAHDGELLGNDLVATDVDEGASGDAGKNDRVDVTSVDHKHTDSHT